MFTVEISPLSALVTKLALLVSIGWQPIVGGGVKKRDLGFQDPNIFHVCGSVKYMKQFCFVYLE